MRWQPSWWTAAKHSRSACKRCWMGGSSCCISRYANVQYQACFDAPASLASMLTPDDHECDAIKAYDC
jgi:hypothetical protein